VLLTKCYAGAQIKKDGIAWACGTFGGQDRAYRVLVKRSEGNRPLERSRRIWEGNTKTDFQDVSWGGNGWTALS
jgi:hypothetical protein